MSFLEQNAMETLIRRQVEQLFAQQFSGASSAFCHLQRATTFNTGAAGAPPIPWDQEVSDTDNMFDPAVNTRITCRTAGMYVMVASLSYSGQGNPMFCRFRINGLLIELGNENVGNALASPTFVGADILRLTVNDYVEVLGGMNTGTIGMFPGSFFKAVRV